MEKESNFFEKDKDEEKNADSESLFVDEKTGRVMTQEEIQEEKIRRQEDPNWWRDQQ